MKALGATLATWLAVLLVVALAPQSSWSLKNQVSAISGFWLPPYDGSSSRPNLIQPSLDSADWETRLVASLNDQSLTNSERAEALLALAKDRPGDPLPLGLACRTAMAFGPVGESTGKALATVRASARQGIAVDPENGFFPHCLAAMEWLHGDRQDSLEALERASRATRYDDFVLAEAELRIRVLEREQGYRGNFARVMVYSSIMLPHVSTIRQFGQEAAPEMVPRERAMLFESANVMARHADTLTSILIARGVAGHALKPEAKRFSLRPTSDEQVTLAKAAEELDEAAPGVIRPDAKQAWRNLSSSVRNIDDFMGAGYTAELQSAFDHGRPFWPAKAFLALVSMLALFGFSRLWSRAENKWSPAMPLVAAFLATVASWLIADRLGETLVSTSALSAITLPLAFALSTARWAKIATGLWIGLLILLALVANPHLGLITAVCGGVLALLIALGGQMLLTTPRQERLVLTLGFLCCIIGAAWDPEGLTNDAIINPVPALAMGTALLLRWDRLARWHTANAVFVGAALAGLIGYVFVNQQLQWGDPATEAVRTLAVILLLSPVFASVPISSQTYRATAFASAAFLAVFVLGTAQEVRQDQRDGVLLKQLMGEADALRAKIGLRPLAD